MKTPARIAAGRLSAFHTYPGVTEYLNELERIGEQHKHDVIKQKMLCDYVLLTAMEHVMEEFGKKNALIAARRESAKKDFGEKTVRRSILSLPKALAPRE